MSVTLRAARDDERPVLDDICFRSKAHWGYDTTFMENVRDQIRVSARAVAEDHVWVAIDRGDAPGGVMQIDRLDAVTADLTLLFIAPECLRRGFGRALFEKACAIARGMGVGALLIDSDPQAAAFYAAMGADRLADAPNGYQGRLLPRFSMRIG